MTINGKYCWSCHFMLILQRLVFVRCRNPIRFLTFLRTLSFADYSTSIKAGVHYTLCGGSISALGTKKHHKWLDKLDSLEVLGSLSMTELGHGSNVAEVETIASYDAKTQEFILNSPTETSQKFWIGGMAEDALITVVIAQLHINGKNHGVHAFVVEVRDKDKKTKPGVFIKDNGPKMGLNGVDNGRAWFKNCRIPLENLLDKYAQVSPEGKYSSPIKSPVVRFATMIGGLVGGRVLIAAAAVDGVKVALSNAIKFSLQRKQFGEAPGKEMSIMGYLSHQRRLIPAVATTYAVEAVLNQSAHLFANKKPETMKQVHLFAAGVKAFASWHKSETAANCRQCMGGQGFSVYSKIPEVMMDLDIDTTFEGDNTVLVQQITKSNLSTYASRLKQGTAKRDISIPEFNLESAHWFKAVFKKRDYDKLRDLFNGIAALRQEGLSEFDAYNKMLDLGLLSAWATMERMGFSSFHSVINQEKVSPSAKKLLTKCLRLFALDRIERDVGYFVSEGILDKAKVRAVRNTLNDLCEDLYASGDLLTLIDGWNLPEITESPIAKDYVKFWSLKSKY
eukprot:TRINITY_DN2455_c0_g1_i4.p1 TRINITY_DN2455_c0_g1~~TRINITY_DN2455_c0_g1_i4.p1  ORF type:complete len:564 (+),score=140.01 TRINITY_DN2455_c0_g1_i4:495-2186(+)